MIVYFWSKLINHVETVSYNLAHMLAIRRIG